VKAFLSKKLVIGATGIVMLAGTGAAVAATQSSTSPSAQAQAYINDLAAKLNVTPSALTAAIKGADSDQIDAAVAAGRLTQAQATALKARIQASTVAPFLGHGFGGGRFGRGGFGRSDAAAATYLGITEATLRTDLAGGQSLAQIAAATPGKSVAGLEAALIAAETTKLNAAVSSGQITSQQAQQRLSDLTSRISTLVQRTGTAGRNWSGGRHTWSGTGATGASGSTLYGA
jgi:predicted RNA-binding protein associated with RNAse of E/G family